MEASSDDVSITARGKTSIASSSVVPRLPNFECLLSGQWKQSENKSIEADPSILKAFVSYSDNLFCPSLLFTKPSRSKSVKGVIELAIFCVAVSLSWTIPKSWSNLRSVWRIFVNKVWKIWQDTAMNLWMHLTIVMLGTLRLSLPFFLSRGKLNLPSNQIRSKVYNDVLFIVSHAKLFGPRLRTHVRRFFGGCSLLQPSRRRHPVNGWVLEDFHSTFIQAVIIIVMMVARLTERDPKAPFDLLMMKMPIGTLVWTWTTDE